MRTINICNTEIQIKDCECIYEGGKLLHREIEDQYVDVTVILASRCNMHCKFCCGPKEDIQFKLKLFKEFFSELIEKIRVRKVTFTGGECSLENYFRQLELASEYIKSKSPSTWVILNTNGFSGVRYHRFQTKLIDQFAVSRHHYNSDINHKLMGSDRIQDHMLDCSELYDYLDPKKINLTCVVQKTGISSGEELEKYFDWAIKHEIYDVSVVSLIPVNDYCLENFVDPYLFKFSDKVHNYKVWNYPTENVCTCSNFVYLNMEESNIPLRFYMRKNLNCKFNKGSYIVWKNNKIDVY